MDDNPAKIVEALHKSNEVIYKADTIFPFTVFPDTVSIDREKITIAKRLFFRTAEIKSFHFDDVLNITADVGPFFGSIQLTTKFFDNKPLVVKFLSRRDAMAIKRILHGHMVAREHKINTTDFHKDVLVAMLFDLGHDISD